VTVVRVSGVDDFEALGRRWRDLEQRADCSFFQSWTWYGCLAAERFTDPVLVEATEAGRTVALALFNRVRRRFAPPELHLGESGQPDLDCPYIEQNGVLTEAGRSEELAAACLRAVAPRHRLILSGIDRLTLAAVRQAADLVWVRRTRASPTLDLAPIRQSGAGYLATRSANTREQIRRSARFFERAGAIETERAETLPAALRMLDELELLHQAAWTARGLPGSFATPFFRRFHAALITEALPRGEVTLLRISGGGAVIGVLYGFSFRRRICAYQSGFDYGHGKGPAKPGLTCHSAAIQDALDRGFEVYDFLAGDDRYKRSLGDGAYPQHWAEAGPFWSLPLLARQARAALGTLERFQADWKGGGRSHTVMAQLVRATSTSALPRQAGP
jgi:CelD/BcsL family acetyltransferase involved in cellulose biosynthesis